MYHFLESKLKKFLLPEKNNYMVFYQRFKNILLDQWYSNIFMYKMMLLLVDICPSKVN